jgi:Carboxypeptidase regulatory-like domain
LLRDQARKATMENRTAMRWILCFLILASPIPARSAADSGGLKILVSIDQTTITAPFPARIILHLHNSGQRTLRVYTPVRDATVVSGAINPFTTEAPGPGSTRGGSALEVHLAPLDSATPESPAEGKVLESAGFPHSKLVAIPPGEDYEEKAVLHLSPASADENGSHPLWGRYKLSITYSAHYSNGADLNRVLDAGVWEDEIESNSIEVTLQPPSPEARGSAGGTVLGSDMQPAFGAIVTLSDQQEQVLGQSVPDANGAFSFNHLPVGFYWLTARYLGASEDATVFRHVQLDSNEPAGSAQLVMLRPEVYHAQQLQHKPVLFRVLNRDDQPLADVSIAATWSSGTVLDKGKTRTEKDGTATLELIPGRNYLTLREGGCPKQDERVDVAPGGGIDGFKLVFACTKR